MFDQYTEEEIKLAQEIAHKLTDYKSMRFHLQNARTYTERFLREQLEAVLAKPPHTITNSRAAYYNFLISCKGTPDDFRH